MSYSSTSSTPTPRGLSPSLSDSNVLDFLGAREQQRVNQLSGIPSRKQDRMEEWISNLVNQMDQPLSSPDSVYSPTTPRVVMLGSRASESTSTSSAFGYGFAADMNAGQNESPSDLNDLIKLSSPVEDGLFPGGSTSTNGVLSHSGSDRLPSSEIKPSSAPTRMSYLGENPFPVPPKISRDSRTQFSYTDEIQVSQENTSHTMSTSTLMEEQVTTVQVTSRKFEGMASTSQKPFRPTPLPRTNPSRSNIDSAGSLSRSVSDVSDFASKSPKERKAPPIKPRRSLLFDSPDPPPKPPRPTSLHLPKPEPYASRSADSSPNNTRKAWKIPVEGAELKLVDTESTSSLEKRS